MTNPSRQSLFKSAVLLALCTFAFTICRAGDASDPQLSPKQWRDDLQFFARELPKRHMNAFHLISREKFDSEVSDLDHKLDSSDLDHMFVALRVITASVGDGHTGINLPESAPPLQFPISIASFGDDYRVTGAAPEFEKALGARMMKIGDTPVKRVAELLFRTTPQDEYPWYGMNIVNSFLANARMLHGLDIIPNHDTAQYTLVDAEGKEFTIDVHSLPPVDYAKIQLAHAYKEGPLYTQKPGENFWFTYLPASRTVYCDVRVIRDLSGPAKSLMSYLKDHEKEVDKLVIDLRQNGGGDYNEGLHHLVEPLRDNPHINQKGHLFVLIGPRTFSAAMSNATHFRYRTNAMLVGTPIGEKPNSFAEKSQMTLPNSKMIVTYSVKFYKFVETGENIVRPDQEINTTWEDFIAGRDPALEWILNYTGK